MAASRLHPRDLIQDDIGAAHVHVECLERILLAELHLRDSGEMEYRVKFMLFQKAQDQFLVADIAFDELYS